MQNVHSERMIQSMWLCSCVDFLLTVCARQCRAKDTADSFKLKADTSPICMELCIVRNPVIFFERSCIIP